MVSDQGQAVMMQKGIAAGSTPYGFVTVIIRAEPNSGIMKSVFTVPMSGRIMITALLPVSLNGMTEITKIEQQEMIMGSGEIMITGSGEIIMM
jgi:hypothetical protein